MLALQGTQVPSLIRELRSHTPRGVEKTKQKLIISRALTYHEKGKAGQGKESDEKGEDHVG